MSLSGFQVRVVSPWFEELDTENVHFSSAIPPEEADALLCEWAPSGELFNFPRRKAWYCCEPESQFPDLKDGSWPKIRTRLEPGEFLFHNHPDPKFRVPHITHFDDLKVKSSDTRIPRAVAIVSNHGGSPWRRHPDNAFRNRFATHSLVDLYGRDSWSRYRAGRFSRIRKPANYRGSLPGDWHAKEKRELMARYQVAVCLENTLESNYFTEKFVEAICAGCVPVYRAHPTVSKSFLAGAAWVDPQDHGNEPERTIAFALAADRHRFLETNARWLAENRDLAMTHANRVFTAIGNILATPSF